jgi:hypothetical protein
MMGSSDSIPSSPRLVSDGAGDTRRCACAAARTYHQLLQFVHDGGDGLAVGIQYGRRYQPATSNGDRHTHMNIVKPEAGPAIEPRTCLCAAASATALICSAAGSKRSDTARGVVASSQPRARC